MYIIPFLKSRWPNLFAARFACGQVPTALKTDCHRQMAGANQPDWDKRFEIALQSYCFSQAHAIVFPRVVRPFPESCEFRGFRWQTSSAHRQGGAQSADPFVLAGFPFWELCLYHQHHLVLDNMKVDRCGHLVIWSFGQKGIRTSFPAHYVI